MKPTEGNLKLAIILFLVLIMGVGISGIFAEETAGKVIKITAKKFEYSPNEIRLKKGVPAVLELTSMDRLHGFNCPDLGIRANIEPGKVSRVPVTPQKTGTYAFHCDIFCGEGHEEMSGTIIVEE